MGTRLGSRQEPVAFLNCKWSGEVVSKARTMAVRKNSESWDSSQGCARPRQQRCAPAACARARSLYLPLPQQGSFVRSKAHFLLGLDKGLARSGERIGRCGVGQLCKTTHGISVAVVQAAAVLSCVAWPAASPAASRLQARWPAAGAGCRRGPCCACCAGCRRSASRTAVTDRTRTQHIGAAGNVGQHACPAAAQPQRRKGWRWPAVRGCAWVGLLRKPCSGEGEALKRAGRQPPWPPAASCDPAHLLQRVQRVVGAHPQHAQETVKVHLVGVCVAGGGAPTGSWSRGGRTERGGRRPPPPLSAADVRWEASKPARRGLSLSRRAAAAPACRCSASSRASSASSRLPAARACRTSRLWARSQRPSPVPLTGVHPGTTPPAAAPPAYPASTSASSTA